MIPQVSAENLTQTPQLAAAQGTPSLTGPDLYITTASLPPKMVKIILELD